MGVGVGVVAFVFVGGSGCASGRVGVARVGVARVAVHRAVEDPRAEAVHDQRGGRHDEHDVRTRHRGVGEML